MNDVTTAAPALTAQGLTQSFGERSVLSGVDLYLHRGEVLAVGGALRLEGWRLVEEHATA